MSDIAWLRSHINDQKGFLRWLQRMSNQSQTEEERRDINVSIRGTQAEITRLENGLHQAEPQLSLF